VITLGKYKREDRERNGVRAGSTWVRARKRAVLRKRKDMRGQ